MLPILFDKYLEKEDDGKYMFLVVHLLYVILPRRIGAAARAPRGGRLICELGSHAGGSH